MEGQILYRVGEVLATELEDVRDVIYSRKKKMDRSFFLVMEDGKKYLVTVQEKTADK